MDITVTMTEPEIKEAIRDFLRKHDVVSPNKEIDVTMVAGRGTNGHSAVISVKNAIPTLVACDESEALDKPLKENPELQKQLTPVVQTQAQEQAQMPAQEVAINKDVPMPSAPKEPAEALFTPPGEEITAQASAEVNNLFGDPEPTTTQVATDTGSAQEFDPNNISEAVSTESVDKLFG